MLGATTPEGTASEGIGNKSEFAEETEPWGSVTSETELELELDDDDDESADCCSAIHNKEESELVGRITRSGSESGLMIMMLVIDMSLWTR